MRVIPMRLTKPEEVVPYLFEEHDPHFRERVKPGDFIVAGRNFGCGKPHTAGYLGMKGLDMRVLCASAPYSVTRAMMNIALPFMHQCEDITSFVNEGDDIEVDCVTGQVVNHTTGESRSYPPIDERVREMMSRGGLEGLLVNWLREHPELAAEPEPS